MNHLGGLFEWWAAAQGSDPGVTSGRWVPESAQLNSGCSRLHLWFSPGDRAGVYYL